MKIALRSLYLTVIALYMVFIGLTPTICGAWQQKPYRASTGGKVYKYTNPNSVTRDDDRDGVPNAVDTYNSKWDTDPSFRDTDNDGLQDGIDTYDDKWYEN